MMLLSRRTALLGAATLARPALAQGNGPDRPVRLVVPYSAGGVGDTVVRILQPKIAEHLGQAVIVENRTGASGAIAAAAVASAPADGTTLLMEGATFVTMPMVNRSLAIDYEAAFVPVAMATTQPYFLGVRQAFPAEDFAGFLAEARRRPGEITFGTPGVAHIGHFMGELIQSGANVRLEHVPYRGGADASREVGAGRIDAAIISHSSFIPALQAGRVRLIGVTSAQRRPLAPEVPSMGEFIPGYDLTSWIGFFAPTGSPRAAMDRFTLALHHAIRDPVTRDRLIAGGNDPEISDSAQFAAVIARDRAMARRIVANAPSLRG
jgi:tripartite-type tricarboxylate transporter receptor subunit TctC